MTYGKDLMYQTLTGIWVSPKTFSVQVPQFTNYVKKIIALTF